VAKGSTPETRAAGPPGTPQPPLACCSECGSDLVQPESWRELGDGRLRLSLRCPECELRTVGEFEPALVADYDSSLVLGRLELTAVCQAVTRSNMEDEAHRLSRALAFDLIGAEDFAGYNR
jgi:hypothetical protein